MNTSNITNYKPKDFAELLGVSVKTLQRWDREGILKSNRTPTNRRYYTYDQYLTYKGIDAEKDTRQIVIYARVSTRTTLNIATLNTNSIIYKKKTSGKYAEVFFVT